MNKLIEDIRKDNNIKGELISHSHSLTIHKAQRKR